MLRATELGPIGGKLISLVPNGGTTVIKGGRLIDGTGSVPRDNVDIVIRGERIAAVGHREGVVLAEDSDVLVIDGTGRTVMPGLIDAHVHLRGALTSDPYKRFFWPEEGQTGGINAIFAAVVAYRALEAGWTTMTDLGCGPARALKWAINHDVVVGPRILAAVKAISGTGGHTDWLPLPYDLMKEKEYRGHIVDGVDQCRHAVRLNYREGADLIKIMVASAGLQAKSWPPPVTLTHDELAAIVDEAHRRGLIVATHCGGAPSVRAAVAAGVDSVEHGKLEPPDYDILGRMAEQGVSLVPTLSVLYWFHSKGAERGTPQNMVDRAGQQLDLQCAMVRKAKEEGVNIALGTDTGTPKWGVGLNGLELQLLVDAGLTPMEAIVAATRNAAKARGIADQVGTIAPGKLADILVLEVDPLEDIRALQEKGNIAKILRSRDPIS